MLDLRLHGLADRRASAAGAAGPPRGRPGMGQAEAFRRHPAGRGLDPETYSALNSATTAADRPLGPDDDADFLMELERRIRDSRGEDR